MKGGERYKMATASAVGQDVATAMKNARWLGCTAGADITAAFRSQ
jgi:hypothetical protein